MFTRVRHAWLHHSLSRVGMQEWIEDLNTAAVNFDPTRAVKQLRMLSPAHTAGGGAATGDS